MDYQDIGFELNDGIAVITLDRPESLNAFSGRMGEELGHAYRRCDGDDAVRVAIVTGSGRAFCAGADLSGHLCSPGRRVLFGIPGFSAGLGGA